MWYFSAAGAPENGQNVISVGKSVLYRVITPSVRKTAGFYPPTFRSEKVGRGGVKTGGIPLIVENSIVRKSIELGFARVRNASGDGVRGLES